MACIVDVWCDVAWALLMFFCFSSGGGKCECVDCLTSCFVDRLACVRVRVVFMVQYGHTLLHYALYQGNNGAMVGLLLDRGVDPNARANVRVNTHPAQTLSMHTSHTSPAFIVDE